MKKVMKGMKQILSGALMVALFLILASVVRQKMTGEVPGLFGFHLMYVMTGSMEPEIMTGDAVLVRNAKAESLKLGDVICYYGTKGEMAGRLITHKVIRAPYEENGEQLLQTQGVANAAADEPIRAEQVFGKVVLRLRLMGKLYQFFCTVPGLIVILLPIVFMMIREIEQMVKNVKEDISESAAAAASAALQSQSDRRSGQDESDQQRS